MLIIFTLTISVWKSATIVFSVMASPESSFSILTASKSGELGSRKAGLLRLFNSDFFDSNMALCYLWRYNRHEVGIQFAVCERLKAMPASEIEFLLPQLW